MKSRKLIAASAVLMLLTTAGALSVQTETTETENTVTVDIQAEDVGGIRLNQIPSEWQIDSQEDDGALTTANPDQGYVGWVWASRQSSVNTEIQFSKGDNPSADLQLTAENSDGKTIQRSISIGDQSEPGNPDDPEEPEDPDEPENPDQPENPDEPEDPESDGEVIFHEEFENGLNGWENIHGQNIDIRQRSGEQALWLQEGRGSQQGRDNYVRYELEESVRPDTIEFTMHQNSLCSGYCRSNEIMFKPESELEKDTRDSDRRIELDFKRRTVNQQYDGVQTIVGPLDGDELFENPFQGDWTTFRLEMDWENDRIGALYVDGEKKLEDVEVQGEVSSIKAIDINRGFYSSEPLWVDEIKLYNGDGTETEGEDTDNTGQQLETLKDFSEGLGDWSVGKEFMGDRSRDSDSSGTYSENYGGSVKVNVEGAPGGMDVYKEVDQPIPEGAEIKAYYRPSEGSWSAGGPALKLRYPDSDNVQLENENERTEKNGVLEGEVPKRLPEGGTVHLDSNVWPGSYTVYFTEIKASELGSDQGEPDEPEQPDEPENPDEPDEPEDPEEPQDPENPGELTESEVQSALQTLNTIDESLQKLQSSMQQLEDEYREQGEQEKASDWSEAQIKINAAIAKIQTIRTDLQDEPGGDMTSQQLEEDINELKTGVQQALTAILEA